MAQYTPKILLHNLSNSDGSALYTSSKGTHTLQSAIHYPLEVPYRSDELPSDTYIEVSLRPHNGVAMVKERHIEETVRKALKSIILGEETPRCMLQATIQIMEVEADEELSGGVKGGGQGEGYLDTLVGAVNSSILGCLDGGVQMKGLVGAVLVGIAGDRSLIVSPNVHERKICTSLHAFAFNTKGECVLIESQGSFEIEEWESAEQIGRQAICGGTHTDMAMNGSAGEVPQCLFDAMRVCVEERVARDERWKL